MKYDTCIEQLRVLLDETDPINQPDSIQKFASACAIVNWTTREHPEAYEQFSVFLSYFEIFALNLPGESAISKSSCHAELVKLPMHLPKSQD